VPRDARTVDATAVIDQWAAPQGTATDIGGDIGGCANGVVNGQANKTRL